MAKDLKDTTCCDLHAMDSTKINISKISPKSPTNNTLNLNTGQQRADQDICTP
jgi:hypothetical protein